MQDKVLNREQEESSFKPYDKLFEIAYLEKLSKDLKRQAETLDYYIIARKQDIEKG